MTQESPQDRESLLHNSSREVFLQDVIHGLESSPKSLSPKYFYDERGSQLFDAICGLDEYYLTRTEIALMERYCPQMSERIGPEAHVIEYGSGSGRKTQLLLEHLEAPASYVPVEISPTALEKSVAELTQLFPELTIHPIAADYTRPFALPQSLRDPTSKHVYFPGSTLGNFPPREALAFLRLMRRQVGEQGGVLLGLDTKKDPAILHAAYNDAQGITAAFNKNVLRRINQELGADIDLDAVVHYAFFNPQQGRMEMHLVSLETQTFSLRNGATFRLAKGESIQTEFSYKYTQEEIAALVERAQFTLTETWTDEDQMFAVHYLAAS